MHSAARPRVARLVAGVATFAASGLFYAFLVARLATRSATELEADELLAGLRAVWIAMPLAASASGWWLLRAPVSRLWRSLLALVAAGTAIGFFTPLALVAVDLSRRHGALDAHDVAMCVAGAIAGAGLALTGAPFALLLARLLRPFVYRARESSPKRRRPIWIAASATSLLLAVIAGSMFLRGGADRTASAPRPASNATAVPSGSFNDQRGLVVENPNGPDGATPPAGDAERLRRERITHSLASVRGLLVEEAQTGLENLILNCERDKVLPDLFEALIDNHLYEPVVALLLHGTQNKRKHPPALDALVRARPDLRETELNAPTIQTIRARTDWDEYPYQVLIVPGYTPVKADHELSIDEIPAAQQRCDLAIADYRAGLAPYILVSGGAVHPAGTRYNEALSMHAYLLTHGIPANQILVDAHARHSTTNLRNAGRMMLDLNMKHGLIVTGFESAVFDQAFYFANPVLSSFERRCRRELGFMVGELRGIGDHHISFIPAQEVATINYVDPLDG